MRRRNLLRSGSILLLSHALLCTAALILPVLPGDGAGRAQSSATHSREFWRSIVRNNCAVPEGESAFVLARELSGLLGPRIPNCATIWRIQFLPHGLSSRENSRNKNS